MPQASFQNIISGLAGGSGLTRLALEKLATVGVREPTPQQLQSMVNTLLMNPAISGFDYMPERVTEPTTSSAPTSGTVRPPAATPDRTDPYFQQPIPGPATMRSGYRNGPPGPVELSGPGTLQPVSASPGSGRSAELLPAATPPGVGPIRWSPPPTVGPGRENPPMVPASPLETTLRAMEAEQHNLNRTGAWGLDAQAGIPSVGVPPSPLLLGGSSPAAAPGPGPAPGIIPPIAPAPGLNSPGSPMSMAPATAPAAINQTALLGPAPAPPAGMPIPSMWENSIPVLEPELGPSTLAAAFSRPAMMPPQAAPVSGPGPAGRPPMNVPPVAQAGRPAYASPASSASSAAPRQTVSSHLNLLNAALANANRMGDANLAARIEAQIDTITRAWDQVSGRGQ